MLFLHNGCCADATHSLIPNFRRHMSLDKTKKHLVDLLNDHDNKVIALSGKWGTGKSYLWRAVKGESADEKVKTALYISLFGLTSMDQVKLKIVQSTIANAEENPTWWEKSKTKLGGLSKALQSFDKRFSILDEFALLAVPTLLKKRVIVLDDIERKHEKLSIDEVMGFIDEFTQQHETRFLLILNSDQLRDRKVWDTLREKVIDQEVRLETSPAEAFEIANSIKPSIYYDAIKNPIEICGITNIRIICKIIKTVNRILGNRTDLSNDVLSRVVPSTVLLSAIHFKGIADGLDFDFILKIKSHDFAGLKNNEEGLDERTNLEAKWRLLLQELSIYSLEEYEQVVIEFLQSGLFDVAKVEMIIKRFASEAEVMSAQKLSQDFHDHFTWYYKMTDSELLIEAKELAKQAHLLDLFTVSSLHNLISQLAEGSTVAESMVDKWIESVRSKNPDFSNFGNPLHQPIHPRIEATIDELKMADQAKITIIQAFKYVAKEKAWDNKHEIALNSATVADFEATIKSLEVDDLKIFLSGFVKMITIKKIYESSFESAMDNFTEACRNITTDPNQIRLGTLIKRQFKNARIEADLNPPPAMTPVTEDTAPSAATQTT